MTNLHLHFWNGNVKAFRQELEGTGGGQAPAKGGGGGGNSGIGPGSASGGNGKSWLMSGMTGSKGDPNERDMYGRTVLHLAASSMTPLSYSFFQTLLRNPQIQVNLQDQESGYTALHRALFSGNIKAARDLLMRNDIDTSLKDTEGMAAYDLYNGTVNGTNPSQDNDGTDLFVWGVNRNFALGTGDTTDKAFPDPVHLLTQAQAAGREEPSQKFELVGVKDVVMCKFHTGVITTESRGNLSLCGFGANGRLGRSVHSQLALTPIPDFQATIVRIALGQDHTLALTSGGYILSWGMNRFSQLGYVIEAAERFGRDGDDSVQVSPKRIVGPLKKEFVKGVAAGRMASACWTHDALWTWGTNVGQLGYDKASNPVQVNPRKVTSMTQPVADVVFSDYAMVCLLESSEVICFHGDTNFKISFSIPRLLPEAFPFRPPQTTLKPTITKVTSSCVGFAALSSIGDVFTFSLPNPLEDLSKDGKHATVKPQVVWGLRKNFTAVRDVAIGSDGTVIVCTHSGHVYVRQRLKLGSGQLKFRRIPYLQRIIKVATNESGAFGAVRVDARPTPIKVVGNVLEDDLGQLQPHFARLSNQMTAEDFERMEGVRLRGMPLEEEDEDEDESTNSVNRDTSLALKMCTILDRWRTSDVDSLFAWSEPLFSSDCHLVIQGLAIPAHSVMLSLRAPKIARLLAGQYQSPYLSLSVYGSTPAIVLDACHPLVGLLLLHYLYADEVVALWDARVARIIQAKYTSKPIPIAGIKNDLKALAEELGLKPFESVLSYAAKQPLSQRTLSANLSSFFSHTSTIPSSLDSPCDVRIILADKEVSCASVILRARCPFFEAMFGDRDWTSGRKNKEGSVTVNMKHLKWTSMKLVFRWIYEGVEDGLFDYLHQDTLDGFLDFVFEVLATATELLLDRLVLVCSRVIIQHCNTLNAASLACEAAFYQATVLKHSIFAYITSCLETLLESGLLDEMDGQTLQELTNWIIHNQEAKTPVPRKGLLVKDALSKHREWLLQQDIPAPVFKRPGPVKWRLKAAALSPVDITSSNSTPKGKETPKRKPSPSPLFSPEAGPEGVLSVDGIFQMDDDLPTPPSTAFDAQTSKGSRAMTPLNLGVPAASSKGAIWKSRTVETEKADLRSIMAETAATKPSAKTPSMPLTPGPSAAKATFPSLGSGALTPGKPMAIRGHPSSGGPWRAQEARKTSFTALQGQQQAGAATGISPSASTNVSRGIGSQAVPVPQRSGSHHIITPVKLQTPPSGSQPRKAKLNANASAWSTPATFAPPPVPSVSSATQGMSLIAIQHQELQAAEATAKLPTKTLREIQEEEQIREQEKAQEEDFLRWWQEEEARVARESVSGGAQSSLPSMGGRGGRERGRGGRGGKSKGGRGGGQGSQGGRGQEVSRSGPDGPAGPVSSAGKGGRPPRAPQASKAPGSISQTGHNQVKETRA
ncbi:hypothetical protein B9479_002604 [Cryptococcus floricola]|uniref:BTB domain-containing protein n=1 Tax=Cryptococcus floricola TaxID=2591691 RepID=A0A5D3B1U7_9TREE|nr:hypothetical protein B9479_002604 [Cryptococcus floricola]